MLKKLWVNMPAVLRTTLIVTLVNLAVLFARNVWAGNNFFSFLKSNLFIGSLPVLILAVILYYKWQKMNNIVFWFLVLLWVLFYPNAPYMISDLIHDSQDPMYVASHNQKLLVFDTLIIYSISMLSVFYGVLALKMMFRVFRLKYSHTWAHVFIDVTIVLSCLGFYMGREMLSVLKLGNGYLYSWEIFLEPKQIISAVWKLLFPIAVHKKAYAMMALFGIVQVLLFAIFSAVSDPTMGRLFTPEDVAPQTADQK